jgi:hypothetical protein
MSDHMVQSSSLAVAYYSVVHIVPIIKHQRLHLYLSVLPVAVIIVFETPVADAN